MSAISTRELQQLRYTPGTQEYDEDQAMWQALNARRHEVMTFIGTAPSHVPAEFIAPLDLTYENRSR